MYDQYTQPQNMLTNNIGNTNNRTDSVALPPLDGAVAVDGVDVESDGRFVGGVLVGDGVAFDGKDVGVAVGAFDGEFVGFGVFAPSGGAGVDFVFEVQPRSELLASAKPAPPEDLRMESLPCSRSAATPFATTSLSAATAAGLSLNSEPEFAARFKSTFAFASSVTSAVCNPTARCPTPLFGFPLNPMQAHP